MRLPLPEKHRQFTRTSQSHGIPVIRATGEISDDIPALMRGHYDSVWFVLESLWPFQAGMTLARKHRWSPQLNFGAFCGIIQ